MDTLIFQMNIYIKSMIYNNKSSTISNITNKKQTFVVFDYNFMEQVTGIGPASQAWEARILPLNYTCINTF